MNDNTLTATLTGSFLFKGNTMAIKRLDRVGTHRSQFDKNRKKIYATQTICGICGKPVDFSLKFPEVSLIIATYYPKLIRYTQFPILQMKIESQSS